MYVLSSIFNQFQKSRIFRFNSSACKCAEPIIKHLLSELWLVQKTGMCKNGKELFFFFF